MILLAPALGAIHFGGERAGAIGRFGALDWGVVIGFLIAITWLGERLAGRQATLRDFFLGGRRLPWYAVAASMVATEISAVTLVSLPAVVFREGGDLTYLQIGLFGSLLARWAVAAWLVPAYYEREIYSPYDYVGARLGRGVRATTSALFALGQVLAQSARVYLIALVLQVVLHRELARVYEWSGLPPLVSAVALIAVVSVLWTWLGGINTVVWTDALLFLVFLSAVVIALLVVVRDVDGGAGEVLRQARAAHKLRLFDTTFTLSKPYTLWAALFAQSFAGVGAYGVDQLMAQRVFCCRDVRDAQRAVRASYAAMAITALVGLVGVALFAYYRQHPLAGEARALFEAKPDCLFPIFVLQAVPNGLKGLILAGVFAAAISSLDSILAALAQTVIGAWWLPRRARRGARLDDADEQRLALRASRVLVALFGLLLTALAVGCASLQGRFPSVLDLALSMAGYTQGALLAGFLLAVRRRESSLDLGRGYLLSAPLSALGVFVVAWRPLLPPWSAHLLAVAALFLWARGHGLRAAHRSDPRALLALAALVALMEWIARRAAPVSWPWFVPLGCLYAYAGAWAWAAPRVAGPSSAARAAAAGS